MKLYATITSERASKSQGGNKHLDIDIFVGSQDNSVILAALTVRPTQDGYALYDANDNVLASIKESELKQIGKRQKGEMCAYCERPATRERDGHEKVCDEH